MQKNRTKKFLGLFVILFVAIFSVGCVFATACGKKNKEEEEPHTHSYTSTVTKQATCTEEGETTYTCDCGDTYTEPIAALGHDWGAWTEVEAADCEKEGSQTRKCSRCDATEDDVIAALGHDYTVEFAWTGDDETGYTGATATATCSRSDSTLTNLEVKFEAPVGTIYGTYTASVEIDGKQYSETKTITNPNAGETQDPNAPSIDESKVVLNQYVDFGEPDTYTWIESLTNDSTYSDGVLTLVTATGSNKAMEYDTTNGRLKAGGSATAKNGRYFIINLSEYIGDVVEIKIAMRTNTSSDDDSETSTTLYLTNNLNSTSSALASVISYRKAESDPKTLTYVAEITAENAILYTLSDANMHYYSISVRASGDYGPSENEGNNPDTPEPESIIGAWAGNVSFTVDYSTYTGVSLSADVNVIVTEDDFTLSVVNFSGSSLGAIVAPILNALMGDGVPLVVFDGFEWEDNGDGTYTVEAVDDHNNEIEITATINEEGQLSVAFDGTVYVDGLGNLGLHINAAIDKYDGNTMDPVNSVYTSASRVSIYTKDEYELSASVLMTIFDESYTGTYTWVSSDTNEEVIKITSNNNGSSITFETVGAGSATITVTVGNHTATCTITVKEITGVTFSVDDEEIVDTLVVSPETESFEVTANITMATADTTYGDGYKWTSSDGDVVTVEVVQSGTTIKRDTNQALVTVIGEGTATITLTLDDGNDYTFDVTVTEPAPEIITLPTAADVDAYLTIGGAVFANQDDIILTDNGGGTYTVTGTASIMGEAEKTWWGTDTNDAYVVIKIYVPEGYSVTYGNTNKTYENWEGGEGQSKFDGNYVFVVYRILAEDVDHCATYTIKAKDATEGTTYTVDFSGVEIPDASRPENVVSAWNESAELNGTKFTNQTDVSFEMTSWSDGTTEGTAYPWMYIEAYGTASAMTDAQVKAYGTDDSTGEALAIGTGYVVVSVLLHPGDTVWYASKTKTYTNESTDDEYYAIVVALKNYGYTQYMVSSTNNMYDGTMYVIDFSGMTRATISGEVESAADLQAALDAGLDEITVTASSNVSETLVIEAGETAVTITLDKDVTLGSTEDGMSVITVEAGATLTITGEGTISYTGEDNNDSLNNTAAVYTEGTLVIDGATIESDSIGVKAEDGAKVTIENGTTIEATYFALWLGGGNVDVTINGGTISGENKGIVLCGDGDYGYGSGNYQTDAVQTLTVTGGDLSCTYDSVITTLGVTNSTSSIINITGGTFIGADICTEDEEENKTGTPMPTIYIASGTLNISGDPDIKGSTPVEVRGGTTTISGGTFECTAKAESSHMNNNSGATSYGYALSVFPYGSGVKMSGTPVDNAVNVKVTGGTFIGAIYGAVEADYETAVQGNPSYTYCEYTFDITGGTFSENPSEYVAEGYIAKAKAVEETEGAVWVVYETVVEVNFDSNAFSATTQSAYVTKSTENPQVAPGDANVTYADGRETGFTAKGEATDSTTIQISEKSTSDNIGHTVLEFSGTINSTKNSVAYTLEAGTYVVEISYFSASKDGRFATVIVNGENLSSQVTDEQKTQGAGDEETEKVGVNEVLTCEITFTIDTETTIYIGSAYSGLYVTFIGIYKVADDAKEDTEVENNLDEEDDN